ncbi:hypothetical protein C0J52_04278 [Blattella germanica]|nr:hypothetical protein C0J52_04278 [Blattella germanica]
MTVYAEICLLSVFSMKSITQFRCSLTSLWNKSPFSDILAFRMLVWIKQNLV